MFWLNDNFNKIFSYHFHNLYIKLTSEKKRKNKNVTKYIIWFILRFPLCLDAEIFCRDFPKKKRARVFVTRPRFSKKISPKKRGRRGGGGFTVINTMERSMIWKFYFPAISGPRAKYLFIYDSSNIYKYRKFVDFRKQISPHPTTIDVNTSIFNFFVQKKFYVHSIAFARQIFNCTWKYDLTEK